MSREPQGLISEGWGFSTTLPVMAQSMISVLQNPTRTASQYLLIGSFVVTQNDILAALEEATASKCIVSHCDSEETRQICWKLVQAGSPQEGIPKVIQGSLFSDKNDITIDKERFANSLNLSEVDLRGYIKSLVAM